MRGERSEEDIKGGVTRSGKMEVKWLWLLRVAQLLAELLAEQGLACSVLLSSLFPFLLKFKTKN